MKKIFIKGKYRKTYRICLKYKKNVKGILLLKFKLINIIITFKYNL